MMFEPLHILNFPILIWIWRSIVLAFFIVRARWQDMKEKYWDYYVSAPHQDRFAYYTPISRASRHVHYIIKPLWLDLVNRVVGTDVGRLIGYVNQESGTISYKINAASSSYTGWVALDHRGRALQRRALTSGLPISSYGNATLLGKVAEEWKQAYGDVWGVMTSTGYSAVAVAMGGMVCEGSVWLMDASSHNSMVVAARSSRALKIVKFDHNDFEDLERKIQGLEKGYSRLIVAMESLYGMSGSRPDFEKLAQLKSKYGFLVFCDEAHCSLTLTSEEAQRKIVQDQHGFSDVVDVRIANLSKSVGSIGGYVGCSKSELISDLQKRFTLMRDGGLEPMPLLSIIHTLYTIRCRQLVPSMLHRLQQLSNYVQSGLRSVGFEVYGHDGSPVMTVAVGDYVRTTTMCIMCNSHGLAISPTAPPAFKVAGLRLQVTTTMTNEDVTTMLRVLVFCGAKVGIIRPTLAKTQLPFTGVVETQDSHDESKRVRNYAFAATLRDLEEATTRWTADAHRKSLIYNEKVVTNAGLEAVDRYGFGLSSSRWLNGTTQAHLDLEKLMETIFGSHLSVMLLNDSRMAALGVAHALARPLDTCAAHHLLYEDDESTAVWEGLASAKQDEAVVLEPLCSRDKIKAKVAALASGDQTGITVFLDGLANDSVDEFRHSVAQLGAKARRTKCDVTLVLDLSAKRGLDIARELNIRQLMAETGIRIIATGSFYNAIGLPGAFLVGDKYLVEELRWTTPTYFFSTSMPAPLCYLVQKELESRNS